MIERIISCGTAPARFGILAEPARSRAAAAFVLVNSGVVHRIGANRMTVLLARHLAGQGYPSLRFDISGLGDTPDRDDGLGWESAAPLEIAEVSAVFDDRDGGKPAIVLYGNCGGAAKSFWTALAEPGIAGLVLTNPPPLPHDPHDDEGTAGPPPPHATQLNALFKRGMKAVFIFAEGDEGETYFDRRLAPWLGEALTANSLAVVRIPAANHTFASVSAQEQVLAAISAWTNRHFAVMET